MPMMFFYFLKIIFDISTAKRSKKYKPHSILAKKKIQNLMKYNYKHNTKRFYFFWISTGYPGRNPTNPGGAQVLGKKFPASAPRLNHGLRPSPMALWNCLHQARLEPGNLDRSKLPSPSSHPLGQPHEVVKPKLAKEKKNAITSFVFLFFFFFFAFCQTWL